MAPRFDYAKWITLAILVAGTFIGVVVWAQSNLDSKAARVVVSEQEARIIRLETDEGWIKAALWQIALRTGATVPPPPGVQMDLHRP